MTAPQEPWDPGLQNERTTLAWVRSALSFAAVGTLVAKQAGGAATFGVLMVLALLTATLMAATAERRHHGREGALRSSRSVAAPLPILGTTVATVAVAALAFVAVTT